MSGSHVRSVGIRRGAFCISAALFASVLIGEDELATAKDTPNVAPNVLLIIIDDLRPELGCYGASHVKSPNIDRLAKSGRLFRAAYCQQAVCNPSRTSMMTGLRPDRIGVVGNHSHFRDNRPNVVTLPQHFKRHGYTSQAIGKIYHGVFPDGASKTTWDTMGDPPSWSTPAIRFGPRYYFTEEGVAEAKRAFLSAYRPSNTGAGNWKEKLVFGPMTEAPDVPDSLLYDGKVAETAVETIAGFGKHHKSQDAKPFFLAVGFIKPHSPFVAPKKYWDLYDREKIVLAEYPAFPKDAPAFAGHGSHEIRRYTDQPKKGEFTESNQRKLKHAYYACISFVDAQVGLILDSLRESGLDDNTIVVLCSDHGYHLGEHGLWGKTTNFELDTRVPLIVRTPNQSEPGKETGALAELVDIYPTLADLADLPIAKTLEGSSLKQPVRDPNRIVDDAAISQFPRGIITGYSIRISDWRYTEWVDSITKATVARELYDHRGESLESMKIETENVADSHPAEVGWLAGLLFAGTPATEGKSKANTDANEPSGATGFETLAAGDLGAQSDGSGEWSAKVGDATVHTHHKRSGNQSLRLLGGKNRIVTWSVADKTGVADSLELWFERWTIRRPFEFRIEAMVDGKWHTLHHDTRKAIVGSFRNRLSLALPSPTPKQFRFTSTTPANSGIIIDDVSLAKSGPMEITDISEVQQVSPVLIRNQINPVLDLQVTAKGSMSPIGVSELRVNLNGTTKLSDIEYVEVYTTNGRIPDWRGIETNSDSLQRFGKTQAPAREITFKGDFSLQPGVNHFFASVKLNPTASLDRRISAQCESITADKVRTVASPKKPIPQRIGFAVRKANDDNSQAFRIPGLATTNKGTLIGVYDIRYRGWGDLPNDIDVGMSRSTDGGQTWEPMKAIMDMGDDKKWRYDGVGDPSILVDERTGTVWVTATWSHGDRSWFGSGPGLKPEETGQVMLVRSDDDGVTWSKPINITSQIKKTEWSFILQGPGRGITMKDGTLVFPAQYQDPPDQKRTPHSTIIYSKDRGETWQCGTAAFDETTESAVAEIEPGVLMLNCRYNKQNRRVVMITRDLGKTWEEHPTSRKTLPEPGACMGSLIGTLPGDANNNEPLLLFSNPNTESGPRRRMSIKVSNDRGMTWPAHWHTLLDEGACAGYSCLTMLDNEYVGILFEGSRSHMTFLRLPLSELAAVPDVFTPDSTKTTNSLDAVEAVSEVQLARVFQDHMLLQCGLPLTIWRNGNAGATVRVSFDDTKAAATANRTMEPNSVAMATHL